MPMIMTGSCGHTLIVRRAAEGEKLVTLDNQERSLDSSMITIADTEHAVGLGGVMGGLETEVTADTVNVMLEAATLTDLRFAVLRKH